MLKIVKNQKYVTPEQAVQAAERSHRKAAICCSALHWKQLATAPLGDLVTEELGFSAAECALCGRFSENCSNCPLFAALGNTECYRSRQLYRQASNTITTLQNNEHPTKALRDTAVKHFRRTAEKLMKIIEGLL
jgi:hypothetical protein